MSMSYHIESRFSNLEYTAQLALEALRDYWTELYGPHEELTAAFDCLDAVREIFEERMADLRVEERNSHENVLGR